MLENENNKIAQTLKIIAYLIFLFGFIAGIAFANVDIDYYTEWSLNIAIIYWVGAFVSGTIFLGFSEIISLLQELVNKNSLSENIPPTEQFSDLPKL